MAQSASVVVTEYSSSEESSFFPVVVISLTFHIIVFVGIPVLTRIVYHAEPYSRPHTFQLVSPSVIKTPISPIPRHQASVSRPKRTETTPVPKNQRSKRETVKEPVKEENTKDLSELLDAVETTTTSDIAPTQNFKYPWYLQNILSKVEEQWKPPMGLTDKKGASVVLFFTILQNGSISGLSVVTSSGVSTLDNLGMRAIHLAAPFGKLPIGFSENKLDITYTLYLPK